MENTDGQCSHSCCPQTVGCSEGGEGLGGEVSVGWMLFRDNALFNVPDLSGCVPFFSNSAGHTESQGQPAITMACLCTA